MEVWIATTNKGKLIEFRTLFESRGIVVKSPGDLPVYSAPPETGKTFVENARIKAKTMKALKPGQWIIGEDSGLEVIGLNKFPGIHSARYAGEKASDSENTMKLLKMMSLRSAEKREAQYVCTIVAYSPTGEEFIFEGFMKGQIARKPAGQMGFGYDPVFVPEGQTQTLGELDPGFKSKVSHRSVAARQFLEKALPTNV